MPSARCEVVVKSSVVDQPSPGNSRIYEHEAEAGREIQAWRLWAPTSPVLEGRCGCGRSECVRRKWASWDGRRITRRVPRETLGGAREPVRPMTGWVVRFSAWRCAGDACQRKVVVGGLWGVVRSPSAEGVFQIIENGSAGDPSVGPCMSNRDFDVAGPHYRVPGNCSGDHMGHPRQGGAAS